jgi:hypothetical protein
MTNPSRMKSSRGRRLRRVTQKLPEPLPSTTQYSGPVTIPASDSISVILLDSYNVTATLGVVSLIFNNNPSSARNWTEYSTAWNQYRVLGIKFRYFPYQNTPNGITLSGAGYSSIYHGTAAGPTTLPIAASTGIAQPWSVFQRFTRNWRMSEANEAAFTLTSAPASSSDTMVLYSNNISAAGATVGYVEVSYLIQFKTHTL